MPIFIGPQSSTPAAPRVGYRTALLSGERGTAQTIELMRRLIDDALTDPAFVRQAIDIVRTVPAFDDHGEAEAVYNWVRSNIRFTKDPVTKEKLTPPRELLKLRAGDCDDISMLAGAFLIALGYPARLVTVAANANQPNEFTHVYVEGEVPPGSGNWVPMDAARSDSEFAAEPPRYYRKRAWSLTDESYQDLSGLAHANTVYLDKRAAVSGLGSYATLGQDGIDWGSIVQQSIAEVPAIISTVQGKPVSMQLPAGSVSTGPYGSFVTPYTPGYGIPQAGYSARGTITVPGTTPSWLIPALLVGGVLLLLGGRH